MDPSRSLPLAPADRRAFLWFMLFALVVLAAGIGLRDPGPSDEPRFMLVAKQMVESGDWLFPHRGRELYSDKPPLLFWLQAGAFEVLRDWRIAFLLPSLLAGLLTLGLTWDLGRRLWSPRAGLLAAIGVLFAFQFVYQVKRAQIDPLVMGWITLANWGLLLHFLRGPHWRAYWLGCLAAGLGVISKGVGFLALLMFVPYLYARMRGWDGVTRTQASTLRWLGGLAAFLLPVLAWGVSVLVAAHASGSAEYAAYVDDLFLRQTAQRYAKSWSHAQPFWYFLPVLLFNWFPLSLAYAAAVPQWLRDLRARDARVLLPLAWSLLLLVFFSIPTGKRDVYLMPVLPMLALAMAPTLVRIEHARWLRLIGFVLALACGVLLGAVGAWALLKHPPAADAFLRKRELEDLAHVVWGMLVAIGAMFLLAAAWFRPRRGVHALLAGITGLWMTWSLVAQPLLNDSSSAAGVMRRARELAGPGAAIGLVAWKEQNLLMAQGPVQEFGFRNPWERQYAEAADWLQREPSTRRLFVLEDVFARVAPCVERDKAVYVGHANRREWWLLDASAIVAGCTPSQGDSTDDDEGDP